MSLHYVTSGYKAAKSRPGLSGLMYGVNLILGLVLSIPVLVAFSQATADSGYSEEMAEGFDLALWADLMEKSGPLMQALIAQFIWILPILFVWKMASSAGLIYAQSGSGDKSFWSGLGQHGGKAILLGALYLVPTVAVIIGIAIVVVLLSAFMTGEVGSFWVQFVFTPLALFLGVAFIDMMHDFGRIELILGKKGIMDAWFAGMKWPLRSGYANSIYIGWMLIGILILLLPFVFNFSAAGLVLAFVAQQIFLWGRSFVTVAWIGSEVQLYEDTAPAVEEIPVEVVGDELP